MRLLIDHADIAQIKEILEYYPIDGVTTNPSILSNAGRPPFEVLSEIRSLIGEESELHAQVISKKAEDMAVEARYIAEKIGGNICVKIPAIPEGFKAMKLLRDDGIRLTATAVYTPMQAYLSAKCGVYCVAPYINRMDNMGYNGIQVAKEIQDIFDNNGFDTILLGASFKNSLQVLELASYGVGAATVAPEIIKQFVANPAIFSAVNDFVTDFEALTGKGKTMLDC